MSDKSLCCAVRALRTRREGFDYAFHERLQHGVGGVYAFWLKAGACLYVGESERRLSERIRDHRMRETNLRLKRYLQTFGREIQVSCLVLPGKSRGELLSLEQKLIDVLRPRTNIKGT